LKVRHIVKELSNDEANMPVRCHMTWSATGRRWMKKYKGKWHAISCRKLGVPETKQASWMAANAWWEEQQKAIDAAPPTEEDIRVNAFRVWAMVQDWQHLDESSREKLVDSLVGAGQYQKIKAQADAMVASAVKAVPPERTVKAQVEAWQTLLRGVCQSGQMSEGRFDAYCRNIGKFVEWIGQDTAIDAIDEAKLEGFFNHLSIQVGASKYSPHYAHTLMMTAKQFISRLAEMKLVPVPANIRSRRFRFNHSAPAKIETFSVEEVRAMLKRCDGFSERTKLYLLLMLNCGMYQNDIAELLCDEVNWKKGTLTRVRSKTRERSGPVVTYKLWPETFALLKKHRAGEGELALTTDEGKPLVRYWLEDGIMRRYDVIQSAWTRLAAKLGVKKIRPATVDQAWPPGSISRSVHSGTQEPQPPSPADARMRMAPSASASQRTAICSWYSVPEGPVSVQCLSEPTRAINSACGPP
jgi:integrase